MTVVPPVVGVAGRMWMECGAKSFAAATPNMGMAELVSTSAARRIAGRGVAWDRSGLCVNILIPFQETIRGKRHARIQAVLRLASRRRVCRGSRFLSAPAAAQNYPNQPIRIIVPTPPGGVADLLARAVAQRISANTGKTVIAEQRTGAGGVIAADFVAKSAPDGYTIYMGFHPTQSILVHLQKLPYDPAKDFEPIILVGSSPNMLVVNPVAAGEDSEGARRVRAQESRQGLVRLARQRLVRPHGRRAVQDHAQARPRARAVQGRGAGGDRSRRRVTSR